MPGSIRTRGACGANRPEGWFLHGGTAPVWRMVRKLPILDACTDDTDPHATTKSSRSTEHSRSPPPSVTTNDSEIPAPKSSSHIPDWK